MTDQPPTEKPTRSKRMVLWLVAVPIAVLLLALAGANWKFFHLAYCKHLMSNSDPEEQNRGFEMVINTHLRKGMTMEEVRAILAPAKITEGGLSFSPEPVRAFTARLEGTDLTGDLGFDEDNKLRFFYFIPNIPWGDK